MKKNKKTEKEQLKRKTTHGHETMTTFFKRTDSPRPSSMTTDTGPSTSTNTEASTTTNTETFTMTDTERSMMTDTEHSMMTDTGA